MKSVIIIALAFVLLFPMTVFSYAEKPWTDNIFEWHEKKLITPTEFVNAIGYLTEHRIVLLEKTVERNISGYNENIEEQLKHCSGLSVSECKALREYYQSKTYDYESHETTIWTYKHSSGWEYKITKSYDGILSSYIDGNYIYSDMQVKCPWC